MRTRTLTSIAIASLMSLGTIGAVGRAGADEVGDLYVKKCATCHGRDGKGNTIMGKKLTIKDLTDAKVMAEISDADIETQIRDGVKDKTTGKDRMPAFKDKVTDDQVKALTKFVRTLK